MATARQQFAEERQEMQAKEASGSGQQQQTVSPRSHDRETELHYAFNRKPDYYNHVERRQRMFAPTVGGRHF